MGKWAQSSTPKVDDGSPSSMWFLEGGWFLEIIHFIMKRPVHKQSRGKTTDSARSLFLDSPYGELKFAPPKAYFIDLRQIRANLLQILTKIINIHKMHVQNIQGCHFLRKKSPCGTLHNIAKGLVPLFAVNHSTICRYLPLSAAICRYLPLFAANHFTICRYLPLAFPLFAAICR